jgi:macrophage erythroblast attacher
MNDSINKLRNHVLDLEPDFRAILEKVPVDKYLKRLLEIKISLIKLHMFLINFRPFDSHIIMASFNTEFSYLRAPYEELSSSFRTNKRKIEKELSFCLSHIKNMHKNSNNIDRHQAVGSIEGLCSRVKGFKEKMLDLYEEEDKWVQICEARINSLYSPNSSKTKIIRHLADHYYRQDKDLIANSISAKAQIEPMTEYFFFTKFKKIQEDMLKKDLGSALDWCDSHKSKLKKLSSPLEFDLKLQKFIEFIRSQNFCGGILYARTNLSKFPQYQKEIQKAMMLLAVSNRPEDFSEYQLLLSDSKWNELIQLVHKEMLRVYSMSAESVFNVVLRAGFLALKHPLCQTSDKVDGCPLCNPNIQALAVHIHYACQSHTSMICRILNVVMDENNPPVALPNGQTYSEQGIKTITQDQKITCPVTGAVFNTKQVFKLFVV